MTSPARLLFLLPFLILLSLLASVPAEGQDLITKAKRAQQQEATSARGGLLVLSKKGSLRTSLRGFAFKRLGPGLALLQGDKSDLNLLRQRDGVIAAEENNVVRAHALTSDPLAYRTWSFENRYKKYYAVGPYAEKNRSLKRRSTPDADIDLTRAWQIEKGKSTTKVAVIDTGVDPYHPDLQGNIWNNPGETPDNEVDDDGNGLVDDFFGWNFFDNNNAVLDLYGHGTHVAGTIGARANNGQALPGINQEVSIINAKVLGDGGMGDDASIAAGALYAIEQGARVVNGSLGGPESMPVLANIMRAHPEVLFVFSAGNNGERMPSEGGSWPCLIQSKNNICVASTDARDRLSTFSNYGKKRVHLAAPGENILSLVPFTHGCPGDPGTDCFRYANFAVSETPFSSWTHGGAGDDWGEEEALGDLLEKPLLGLSDSVSGQYAGNSNSWALSPNKSLDTPSPVCRYEGIATGELENGEDVLRISLSTDGGATFSKVGAYTGKLVIGGGFFEIPLAVISSHLPQAAGQTDFQLKYTLTSDGDTEYSGVTILESAISCQGPLANAAVYSGTSMAAPHVSGVAALLFSERPSLHALQAKGALLRGADRKRKALGGKTLGAKRLNAWGALKELE